MLKGQMGTDIEFSAGTIIYIAILLAIMALFVIPLLRLSVASASSGDDVKKVEYANLAASRLTHLAGTGAETEYHRMSALSEAGPRSLGLAENYMEISTIQPGGSWIFDGDKGSIEHAVFMPMRTDILPVQDKNQEILEKGSNYVIHAYRIDGHNMAVDIYRSYMCSDNAALRGGYRPVACSAISSLTHAVMTADDIKTKIVTPVFNGASQDMLAWIEPMADTEANDILPGQSFIGNVFKEVFSDSWECNSTRGDKVCIRLAGDYTVPVILSIDMERKAEYASGLGYGGMGGGDGWGDVTGIVVTPADRTSEDVLSAIRYTSQGGGIINRICSCGTSCNDYATWIVRYSKQYGIPDPLLPLSIMMQESSCSQTPSQGSICNDYGYCGLMQISRSIAGYNNPEINIKEGIKLLKAKYDAYGDGQRAQGCLKTLEYSGWKAAVRGYVGWGCNQKWIEEYDKNPDNIANLNVMKEHDGYVEMVMLRYDEMRKALPG